MTKEKRKRHALHWERIISITLNYVILPIFILAFIRLPVELIPHDIIVAERFFYPWVHIRFSTEARLTIALVILMLWGMQQYWRTRKVILPVGLVALTFVIGNCSLVSDRFQYVLVNNIDSIEQKGLVYHIREYQTFDAALGFAGDYPYWDELIVHKCDRFHLICETLYSEWMQNYNKHVEHGDLYLEVQDNDLLLMFRPISGDAVPEVLEIIEPDIVDKN